MDKESHSSTQVVVCSQGVLVEQPYLFAKVSLETVGQVHQAIRNDGCWAA